MNDTNAFTTPVDYDDVHPKWSCHRKKSYPTQASAERVALVMTSLGNSNLRAYGCRHCGLWHVGGTSGPREVVSLEDRPRPVRRRPGKDGSYSTLRRRHRRERHDRDDEGYD